MSVKRIGVHPDERRKSVLKSIGTKRNTSSEADIEKEIYEMIIKYFVR